MSVFIYLFEAQDSEKIAIEAYGRAIFRVAEIKNKKLAMQYHERYMLIFLPEKKVILVMDNFLPDLLVLGANISINITPNVSDRFYKHVEGGPFYNNIIESPVLQTIYQTLNKEFKVQRELNKNLFEIVHSYNEVAGNLTAPYLVCLSNRLIFTKYPLYVSLVLPFENVKVLSKLLKLRNIARLQSDSLAGRKMLVALEHRMTTINGYGVRSYTVNEDFTGLIIRRDQNPNTPFIATIPSEGVSHVYEFEKAVDYFDITSPVNPAIITLTTQIKYNENYFFDISEISTGINNYTTAKEDIEPSNLRYLFDVPIDNSNVATAFPYTFIPFYFDGNELKYRTIFDYLNNAAYLIFIHDYVLNSPITFNTFVNFEVQLAATSGLSILLDLNSPTQVPVLEQVLYDDTDAYDGFIDEGIFSWFSIPDQITYYRVLTIDDYAEFQSGSIKNLDSLQGTAAALPTIKTQNIPLLCTATFTGTYPSGAPDYDSGSFNNTSNINGQLLFNGYITNFTYERRFHGEAIYSGTTVVSSDYYFDMTSTGLPLEDNLTSYVITTDFFGDILVLKESASLIDGTSFFQTNNDGTVEVYIISKENVDAHITDIVSLLSFLVSQEPIVIIETGTSFEDASYWRTNAQVTNTGFGFEGYEETYPAGVFLFETLWASPLEPFKQYGSLDLALPIKYPVGYVDSVGGYDYSNVSFLPNIFVLDRMYYTSAVSEPSSIIEEKCFHRIYLVDQNLVRIGRCDLLWSAAFHFALLEFMLYHPDIIDIVLAKGTNENSLTAEESDKLALARSSYNAFNLAFGSDILYNDFASYELLYYIFGAADLRPDLGSGYRHSQDVIIVLTTDDIGRI